MTQRVGYGSCDVKGALPDNDSAPERYAIILAGGEGSRAGGDVPKQFRTVAGKPVLWWSMKAFATENPGTRLIVVIHPGFFDEWELILSAMLESERIPHEICCGGRSRFESVANGLGFIPEGSHGLVAVHDAARPMLTPGLIERGWSSASVSGAAVPVIPVTDSIRTLGNDGESRAVDRSRYVAVQTPQIFDIDLLKKAYSQQYSPDFTDDASVVEKCGHNVALYEGDSRNIKITYPYDFEIATMLLRRDSGEDTEGD